MNEADIPTLMRQRFIDALRRAEMITLVNAAADERELGRAVTEELAEAFDAEIAILLDSPPGDNGWRIIATTGLDRRQAGMVAKSQLWLRAVRSTASVRESGFPVDGLGPGVALGAGFAGKGGQHRVVTGVVRLYPQDYDDAEAALLETVASGVGHALERLWAQAERERLFKEVRETLLGTAESLSNALEAKDDYTAGHARQIAEFAVELGAELGLAGDSLEELRFAAIFHDVGKIAVPDHILRKPEPLTPSEKQVMEQHTVAGERIIAPVPNLGQAPRLVRHTHERWDGTGYPDGLRGEEIPLGSRIISVVDAWHAMRSDRPYRTAMTVEAAEEQLRANAGSQFDASVVATFLELRRA